MKPSLMWSAPRPGLRRTMQLMLAVAAAGCCHTPTEPPAEKIVKVPSEKALGSFVKVRDGLGDKEVPRTESEIGKGVEGAMNAYPDPKHAFADLQTEFTKNMVCREKGCYAELVAATPEQVVRIETFATSPKSPMAMWSGWRFVSGLYESKADSKQRAGYSDGQRRMAVVVLEGHRWEVQK
jgi:hypothetical protein